MKQDSQREPLTPKQPKNVPQLLRTRLLRAKLAVAELVPLFPDQTLDDPELAFVTEAAAALDRLTHMVFSTQITKSVRLKTRRAAPGSKSI